jgi:hypothetical protein
MDSDNLANALKPVRDELADWIGIDDADGRIRWETGQVETRGPIGIHLTIHPVQCKATSPGSPLTCPELSRRNHSTT